MIKIKPSTLRNATTLAAFGLFFQGLAFIMPYLEYFNIINFGTWFLILALILNLLSIIFLLYFFLIFYEALLSLLRGLYSKQNEIDVPRKR